MNRDKPKKITALWHTSGLKPFMELPPGHYSMIVDEDGTVSCTLDAVEKDGNPLDTIVFKAGTVIKVGGMPFRLLEDTCVGGRRENLSLIGAEVLGFGKRLRTRPTAQFNP